MRLAIDVARNSLPEKREDGKAPPAVGAVAVRDGQLLGSAFRGQTGAGDHAEFGIIKSLGGADDVLAGATVYTTLEPCTFRSENKIPCADRLIAQGVKRVFIGFYDPDPKVNRIGWERLTSAGVEVLDFTSELRHEISVLLEPFRVHYTEAASTRREATFDFKQNGGGFVIRVGEFSFRTEWGGAGPNAMYAYALPRHIGLARKAREFSQIDDPAAYEFQSHVEAVGLGEIVIYREGMHHLLVQVVGIDPGPDHGTLHTSVTIRWEPRMAV